ncbi:MAG: DUF349 domain-containing protein [Tannerella sp.]|jgi:hypothetical protein|nr:DUF349 domain-containing protein [Tannerella sp.]
MDTQEKDLPEEEKILTEDETGKLEETTEPVDNPEDTTPLAEVEGELAIQETEGEKDAEDVQNSSEEEVEKPLSSEEDTEKLPDSFEENTEKLSDSSEEVAEEPLDSSEEDTEEPLDSSEEASEEPSDSSEEVAEEPLDSFEEDAEEPLDSSEEDTEDLLDSPEDDTLESLNSATLNAMGKPEIVERLKLVVADPDRYVRNEADTLKKAFYKIVRAETDAAKKVFLEGGGAEEDFVMPEDAWEPELKSLMAEYKEKRAAVTAEEERQKEANYLLKQQLIDRLKELTESQNDFNKRYNEFRDIQRKWKEIRAVPQDKVKELWRSYQLYNERFYDLVKINNQFRDYDFKKNLELKTGLCETVERISKEDDPISAFHQLQKLHQQWREIGPVAKAYRDSVWERFKAASTIVNRKYQDHFENLKETEESNLKEKTALCEAIEAINYDSLKKLKDWDKKTAEVIEIQARWKTVGFTTRKQNSKIFERFRKACDSYFDKKSAFFKTVKKEMDENVGLKKALIEKAEALKDSTDWRDGTKQFVDLQNEWKKIGPVGNRYSEVLWKQFSAATNYFFEKKKGVTASGKTTENENLAAKKALLEKIKNMDVSLTEEEALGILREYMTEWSEIGFVPFKEKDKINTEYREIVNKQFDRLKISERDRRLQQYRSNLSDIAGGGKNKLFNERDRLLRTYERMKSELQTYENNIGFFNVSSKSGTNLLKETDHKIARLKEDMEVIIKKIEAIDENLE